MSFMGLPLLRAFNELLQFLSQSRLKVECKYKLNEYNQFVVDIFKYKFMENEYIIINRHIQTIMIYFMNIFAITVQTIKANLTTQLTFTIPSTTPPHPAWGAIEYTWPATASALPPPGRRLPVSKRSSVSSGSSV